MSHFNKTLNAILLLSLFTGYAACSNPNRQTTEITTATLVPLHLGDTVAEPGKNLDCMFQDRNGNYWFASNGEGVYLYNGTALTHITEKQGLCSNFVLSVQQDVNGNIWFSTRDGFCAFNGTSFTDYTQIIRNAPLGNLQYTRGGLFFNHPDGICFYNGKIFTNFVIHPYNYRPEPGNMSRPYGVYATLTDKAGNTWFGTQSQGVCRYDGIQFTYLSDKHLAGPAVRTVFEDKTGTLWFGNNGGGLFRYDGQTLTNITEERNLGNPEFLDGHFNDKPGSLARVWAINEDRDGKLWIGTIDAGLWKLDGTTLTNYTTRDGLGGNAAWYIYKDRSGELWFIINGETICRFNGHTFTPFQFHP